MLISNTDKIISSFVKKKISFVKSIKDCFYSITYTYHYKIDLFFNLKIGMQSNNNAMQVKVIKGKIIENFTIKLFEKTFVLK